MSDTGLDIKFWTDKNGHRRVAFGNATQISDYDLSYGLNTWRKTSIKKNSTNGRLNSSRYKLHNQIIQEYFAGKTPYRQGQQKIALFTGGGTASGKGNFSKDIAKYYSKDENPVKIDSDELKKRLLEADTGKTKLNDFTGAYYHTESTILANRIYEIAVQNNYPVLFDGTSTNFPTIDTRLKLAQKNGYKTKMCFMTSDANTILESSLDRYRIDGRIVPLPTILGTHIAAQSTVPKLFENIDEMKLYNRVGNKISLIAKGGKGMQTTKMDMKLWNNFMNPDAYKLDTGAINLYNERLADIKRQIQAAKARVK